MQATAADVVQTHIKLVHYVAKRFRWALSSTLDYDDLVSEGVIGLMKAHEKFDPGRGLKFTTLAVPMIRWEIQRHLQNREQPVKVPRHIYELAGKILRQNLSHMKADEVAEVLSCSVDLAEEALNYIRLTVDSMDRPIDGTDNEKIRVQDLIPIESDFTSVETSDFLHSLTAHERLFVRLRMEGRTQGEIGKAMGFSQVQASRIQTRIGEKYKRYMEVGEVASGKLTKERYLELQGKGMNDKQIYQSLKIEKSTFYSLKRSWGLTRGSEPVRQRKIEAIACEAKPLTAAETTNPEPANVPVKPEPAAKAPLIRIASATTESPELQALRQENALLKQLLKHYL